MTNDCILWISNMRGTLAAAFDAKTGPCSRVQTSLICRLSGFVLACLFFSPAMTPAADETVNDDLNKSLKRVVENLLKTINHGHVSVGDFKGSTELDADFGKRLENALTTQLTDQRPGIVKKNGNFTFRGRFEESTEITSQVLPGPEASEVTEKKVQIRVVISLVDENGNLIDGWRTVANLRVAKVTKDAMPKPVTPPDPIKAKPQLQLLTLPFSAAVARETQELLADSLDEKSVVSNSLDMSLVLIPEGRYMPRGRNDSPYYGSEVAATVKPFRISATEVTQHQWLKLMDTKPWLKDKHLEGPDHPASSISWKDALDYCRHLTNHERDKGAISEKAEYRLPTELEWEWACRAGKLGPVNFDGPEEDLNQYVSFGEYAQPVKNKRPNAFGLYDTLGNVAEWCYRVDSAEEFGRTLRQLSTKPGTTRGGSFQRAPQRIRTYTRESFDGEGNFETGFRVLLIK